VSDVYCAWRDDKIGESIVHWVRAHRWPNDETHTLFLACQDGVQGQLRMTRILPWRGPEEVTCFFCCVSERFERETRL